MKSYSLIISFLILFSVGCKKDTSLRNHFNKPSWKLIYKNDKSGNGVKGSKEALINAVRKGLPVRVGFGRRRASDTTKSVEHLVEAHFLTIANGEEVFAQISPIVGQHPHLEKDTVAITFRENLEWRIIVGTNGFSDRLTTDRLIDSIAEHRELFMDVSWFVQKISGESQEIVDPLW